jgi:hypothetical protein
VPCRFCGHETLFGTQRKLMAAAVICRTQQKSANSAVVSNAFAVVVGGDEFCSAVGAVGSAGVPCGQHKPGTS